MRTSCRHCQQALRTRLLRPPSLARPTLLRAQACRWLVVPTRVRACRRPTHLRSLGASLWRETREWGGGQPKLGEVVQTHVVRAHPETLALKTLTSHVRGAVPELDLHERPRSTCLSVVHRRHEGSASCGPYRAALHQLLCRCDIDQLHVAPVKLGVDLERANLTRHRKAPAANRFRQRRIQRRQQECACTLRHAPRVAPERRGLRHPSSGQ